MARILFVMHYPGYLRYYDSTVRLLAERGNEVVIAFDSPDKQSEGLESLENMPINVRVFGATPKRQDVWAPLAKVLRTAVDFLRYLHPRYGESRYLRARMELQLASLLRPLAAVRTLAPPTLKRLVEFLMRLEGAIPPSPVITAFLDNVRPDVVLVTPLVTDGSTQVDLIKSARSLGIRTGLCVASWDHLTTKGLIRLQPDRIFVWNEAQKKEAEEFHYVDPARVVVTGAQPFDKWFNRASHTSREEFCSKVGLSPDSPIVLFVGSTASISSPQAEFDFVNRWIEAIRKHPSLNRLGILIRPHPYNMGGWAKADLTAWKNVTVWPREGANPVNEEDRAEYFDSIRHSAAVVGINTSAMIESAIVGRPVLTILPPEFEDTQSGTIHFQYLLPENGGFLRVARGLEEHLAQLAETLHANGSVATSLQRFILNFIRPNGLEKDCTPQLVDAVEELTRLPVSRADARSSFVLRPALWGAAVLMRIFRPRAKKRVAGKAKFPARPPVELAGRS
jgi:hypothetical protein